MTTLIKSLLMIVLVQVFLLGQKKNLTTFTNLKPKSENDIHFELGIRDELIWVFTNQYENPNYKNKTEFLYPINLHLSAGIRFLNSYKIDFRFGLMSNGDYIFGFDEGLFFQTDLFNTNLFGTAGIDFFNNSLASGGTTEAGGQFTFYFLGLGYENETSRNFSIDIVYGFPGKNRVYTTTPPSAYGLDGSQYLTDKINGLFKIGFQYSFVLVGK